MTKKVKAGKVTTGGDVVGKMKVALPLLGGLAARPYLRDLIINYAVHAAAKASHPVMLVKGQPKIEVSEERLLAERRVLERGDFNRPHTVAK